MPICRSGTATYLGLVFLWLMLGRVIIVVKHICGAARYNQSDINAIACIELQIQVDQLDFNCGENLRGKIFGSKQVTES